MACDLGNASLAARWIAVVKHDVWTCDVEWCDHPDHDDVTDEFVGYVDYVGASTRYMDGTMPVTVRLNVPIDAFKRGDRVVIRVEPETTAAEKRDRWKKFSGSLEPELDP